MPHSECYWTLLVIWDFSLTVQDINTQLMLSQTDTWLTLFHTHRQHLNIALYHSWIKSLSCIRSDVLIKEFLHYSYFVTLMRWRRTKMNRKRNMTEAVELLFSTHKNLKHVHISSIQSTSVTYVNLQKKFTKNKK